jgi:hypothetical protein
MAGAPQPFIPTYTITIYDCAKPSEKAEIDRFTALATQQQQQEPKPFDTRVQPWLLGCDPSSKHTIALRHYIAWKGPVGNETIVGWMVAETRRRFGSLYVYLSEISVTRIPSDEHREIGKRLHAELVRVSKTIDHAPFIYLFPLTPQAKQAYTKWGYATPKEINPANKLYDDVTQQFLMLEGAPKIGRTGIPDDLLIALRGPAPSTFISRAHDIAFRLGDIDLVRKIAEIRRDARRDPAFMSTLTEALENIDLYGEELDNEGKLDTLREAIDTFKKKAGGRRTRKHRPRRVRKTRRGHKRH